MALRERMRRTFRLVISGLNEQWRGGYERWQHKTISVIKKDAEPVRGGKKAMQDLNGAKPGGRGACTRIRSSTIAPNVRVLDRRTRIANLKPLGFL
ncbi:hypothetical protein N2605_27560 [Bradyrhizobium yuanmingense]|uniref:hypothetical protein n=1 Tax=Bradyrhizobium yuanmingense TaxID=108015 RepID=UPI0021A58B09|nr:hypothetical protein [Bradyrhizobium sp. CB1024]UWU83257.1 hypothetical protein N2605_27560 [Bradyrhizobium sp. CB1024]